MRILWTTRCLRTPARPTEHLLSHAVAWRDYSAILRGAAETVEHAPGVERDFADGFFPVAFVTKKRRHDANHVWTAFDKDDARVVAHRFQRAGLVGDL